MKPHIVKRLELWWCGSRDRNLVRSAACNTTPQGAYASWRKQIHHTESLKAKQKIREMMAGGRL